MLLSLKQLIYGAILLSFVIVSFTECFSPSSIRNTQLHGLSIHCGTMSKNQPSSNGKIVMSVNKSNDEGVVELISNESKPISNREHSKVSNNAPFMSQGEISKEALNPDFSDPRQTRAVIYTVISLLPVLFLIPLMIGSRDFIPPDMLPPVEM